MSYNNIENHMVCYTAAEHEARFGDEEVSEEEIIVEVERATFETAIEWAENVVCGLGPLYLADQPEFKNFSHEALQLVSQHLSGLIIGVYNANNEDNSWHEAALKFRGE